MEANSKSSCAPHVAISQNFSTMNRSRRRTVFVTVVVLCVCGTMWNTPRRHATDDPHPDDNFPLASVYLPPIPQWNTPPTPHVKEVTPLFIGFTRNWLILQQAVVSYVTAGWPPSDIYVVDNTGTMFSNRHQRLSAQNPAFLDYHRLEDILQVNVLSTPTLLSFSQLQNFFLYEATRRNWTHFFWSHADVAALSTAEAGQYESLYLRAVADYRKALVDASNWAIRFYAYDRLALVSVSAFEAIGGWDIFIPYYPVDCDAYEQLNMKGYKNPSPVIGHIFDVATTVEDLSAFYQVGKPGSESYDSLYGSLDMMMAEKTKEGRDRNTWQNWQRGGRGEPFHYQQLGWERSIAAWISLGRKLYKLKWGTSECRLHSHGWQVDDRWKKRWWL